MNKDIAVFLEHILASINLIESYTDGVTKEIFLNSPQVHDAVIRRIEIIGEAIKNIPPPREPERRFRKLMEQIKRE